VSKTKRERVIVITGASAGVGRAIAQEFAKQGAKLGLIARGEEKLESTVNEVRELGGEALACALDVSDENKLEEAAIEIENKFGPIDIWINNAMVTALGPVSKMSSEEVKRVSDVNYLGSVNGILVANRRFSERSQGHIIQIGSALAYLGIPLQSAYCASKHAIRGFIQSYRVELKASKSLVKISEVHLPAVNTPQFEWMTNHMPEHPMPVPPIFEPEVIGRAVAFIADHPRKEMWVGGPTVKTILGAKFAPWLAEWKLARDGIKDQQTEDAPLTQLSNLWAPISIDFGAKGMFSKVAKQRSIQLWMSMNRKKLGAAGMLVISGVIAILSSRPKKIYFLK
jgi:NADP-dependent 3-hydroxy acid dehydrogenase YdfG